MLELKNTKNELIKESTEEKTQRAIDGYLKNIMNKNTLDATKLTLGVFFSFTSFSSMHNHTHFNNLVAFRNLLLGEGKSPNTIKQKFAILRGFLNHLVDEKIIDENFISKVDIPKVNDVKRTDRLSNENVKALFTACSTDDSSNPNALSDELGIHLLFRLGLRISALTNLKFGDIMLDENGDTILKIRSKGQSVRKIGLPLVLVDMISDYKTNWETLTNLKLNGTDYLMQSKFNKDKCKQVNPISRNHFSTKLNNLATSCGITQKITPHVARATVITELLNHGQSYRNVAGVVGHSSITTTKSYDKGSKDNFKSIVEKLDY